MMWAEIRGAYFRARPPRAGRAGGRSPIAMKEAPVLALRIMVLVLTTILQFAVVGRSAGAPVERPDGAVRLTDPPSGASDQNPAFAPDGTHILFTRFEEGYN